MARRWKITFRLIFIFVIIIHVYGAVRDELLGNQGIISTIRTRKEIRGEAKLPPQS